MKDFKMLSLIDDRKRHSELLNRLNIMRKSNTFCDVTINVENQEFSAHKVILASSSDYFLSKFTEDKSDKLTLNLKKEIFNLLLEYFYTSNLLVSIETIPFIYSASRYLKVKRVVKVCEQFLINNLTVDNVLDIRELISPIENEELCRKSEKFVDENFDIIIKQSNYGTISMDILIESYLTKSSKINVVEFAVDWLENAITDGNVKLSELLKENIRLYMDSSNSLVPISDIKPDKMSCTIVKDYIQGYSKKQKQTLSKHVKSRPRSKERIQNSQNHASSKHHKFSANHRRHTIEQEQQILFVSSENNDKRSYRQMSVNNYEYEAEDNERDQNFVDDDNDSHFISTDENDDNDSSSANFVLKKADKIELDGEKVNRLIVDDSNQNSSNVTPSKPSSYYSKHQPTTLLNNYVDIENFDDDGDDDNGSDFNSIASSNKSNANKTTTETYIIAVKCEEIGDSSNQSDAYPSNNTGVYGKLQFIVKLCGKIVFVSLHITRMLDILTQEQQQQSNSTDSTDLHVNNALYHMSNDCSMINSQNANINNHISCHSSTSSLSVNYQKQSSVGADSGLLPSPYSSTSSVSGGCIVGFGNNMNIYDLLPHGTSSGDYNFPSTIDENQIQQAAICLEYISKMASPRCAAGVVNIADNVMIVGGFNRGECLCSVELYDPNKNVWQDKCCMNVSRARLVALNLTSSGDENSLICAIGGSDGCRELSSVESYDPESNSWTMDYLCSLKQGRMHHGGCVVLSPGHTAQMAIVGGIYGSSILRSVEIYTPANNEWTNLPPLNVGRNQPSVTAIDNIIYVIGGQADSWNCLATGEMLDTREGKWHNLPELNNSRRGAGLVPYKGNLYIFGGADGTSSLRSMEMLNLSMHSTSEPMAWQLTTQQLKQARSNVSGTLLLGNHLLAIGGYTGKHFLDTMEWAELSPSATDPILTSNSIPPNELFLDWSMTVPVGGNWSNYYSCCCFDNNDSSPVTNQINGVLNSVDKEVEKEEDAVDEDCQQFTITASENRQLKNFILEGCKSSN